MATIFHLVTEQDWESANGGQHWRPASLADEGFIHCSGTEDQAMRVVARLYPDRTDLLALEVDTEKLTSPLVSEASRSGEIYPHIYGPLDLGAVIKVWRVNQGGAGGYSLSDQ
ncbi:MAG: DUF952 domain-containing protein [Chloroflexota bacterium]|nr:DUF952 domain-containing protein [Chloroflexota bacterium]